jgi:hypothetical protein
MGHAAVMIYFIVAFGRPAGDTSNALECPAGGGIGMGWIIEDFTQSEVQQRQRTVVLDIRKVPLQGFLQCPRRVYRGNLFVRLKYT